MTLYLHQQQARDFIADRLRSGDGRAAAYLADRPGLGKTRSAIAALIAVRAEHPLIVTPAIVRSHWLRELDEMGLPQWASVFSYDTLVRGGYATMKELLVKEGVTHLVLDEAHYCKHATSQRTQLMLGADGYARRMQGVIALSGTPVPKNPDEFRTTLFSLFPGVATRYGVQTTEKYRAAFCKVGTRYVRGRTVEKIYPEIRNAAEFRAMLAEFMLQRGPDDVGLDVPQLDWQMLLLDAKDAAAGLGDAEGQRRIREAIESGVSLEDITNDPHVARVRRRVGELKAGPVAEMVASQLGDSDEKIVLFAHHRSVMDALQELLQQFGVARIDGDVSEVGRDAVKARFISDPRCRVFLGQNIACQTGMDGLQKVANRCVLVEPDWSDVTNDQLGHRIARMGSGFGRAIGQMVALAGTIDEAIVQQNVREARMRAELEAKT